MFIYVIRMIFLLLQKITLFKLVITLLIDVVNYYANSLVRWAEEILSSVDVKRIYYKTDILARR